MIEKRSRGAGRFWAWAAMVAFTLLATYGAVVAVCSIQVGLTHPLQRGAWMPVLAGALGLIVLFLCLLGAFRLVLAIARPKTRLPI